jgi:hypothetical protein
MVYQSLVVRFCAFDVSLNSERRRGSRRCPESLIRVPKRSQLFIGVYNKTLSIVAVCVNNPDCLPFASIAAIQPPTPSCFAEIVRDDFPVLHPSSR